MKNLKLMSAIALLFTVAILVSFTPSNGDKYPFGNRMATTLVSADTVDVSPKNLTLTYAMMDMDTNAVINVNTVNSIVGDRIVFEFTADSTTRQVVWNSNITALSDSVVATKTKLFEFVCNGTSFLQIGEQQIN